jgi:oxygen-independent coproporphyrinogen-3 oxidase
MAGIYIHIPFCKQKCHYCNFFSVVSLKHKDSFLNNLKKEIAKQKDYLKEDIVKTIYFGGGTPSILTKNEIDSILQTLSKYFNISSNAEITIEANPDDLNLIKLGELSQSLINRLSIGTQSFFDDDLKYLNRVHNSNDAITSIVNAQDVGFSNISIDLIYGIPGLSTEKWASNLNLFFNLNIPHLSAYSLTVEPNTALDVLIRKNKLSPVEDLLSISHFEELIRQTNANDFVHYEISNFSKEGYYSKHNSLYWTGKNYLGLGPSAHSFNGESRQWNVSNISKYIQFLNTDKTIYEKEILSEVQKFNEYVMTSIRTSWGCNLNYVKRTFGNHYFNHLIKISAKHLKYEKLIQKNHILFLTKKGKLFADGVATDLFIDSK